MLKSGILYDDYTFEIGSKYIYSKSPVLGKANGKQLLTPAGKELARWIENNTKYGTMQRHDIMGKIWYDPQYSTIIH